MYIVSYISKSQRGMSNLLSQAAEEARSGNCELRSSVRHIGNKFLNNVEISAQEAVYYILQLPFRQSSRAVLFINTNPPDKRYVILKPYSVIQNMNDNDNNVQTEDLIQKYMHRPKALDNLCLADFASWFEICYVRDESISQGDDVNSDNDEQDNAYSFEELIATKGKTYQHGCIVYRRRKYQKVIRYVNFSIHQNPEDHYRELLMLFRPWRDEQHLKGNNNTYAECYLQNIHAIRSKEKQYTKVSKDVIDIAFSDIENGNHDSNCLNASSILAPNTAHLDDINLSEQNDSLPYQSLEPTCRKQSQYDLGQDIGVKCQLPRS
ncbi:hypothetical protein HOLleu_03886 [Holothuria leucospilota]|uniref:Uncharacterized protein n=1 Tax=Holothuria leucospilota TaxID=206669 RepID=A0A9Q1CS74_HOLLE|nr:hypothetical protein HOLleu_03886 [Holothuria leucospilota]